MISDRRLAVTPALLLVLACVGTTHAQVTTPHVSVDPNRIRAGESARIEVVVAESAAQSAELDAQGVDVDGFVRRMSMRDHEPLTLPGCPIGRRCFTGFLEPSVLLAPGDYTVKVTLVDARGRRTPISVPIVVTPPRDEDANGLPDYWEWDYALWRDTPSYGPNADPDGDGVSNLDEFRAGTNPRARYVRYFTEGSTGDRQPLATRIETRGEGPCRIITIGDGGRRRDQVGDCEGLVMTEDAVADRVVQVVVESAGPASVERQTLSGTPAQLVNSSFGVQEPSRTWYFADGHTADGLDMFLLLFNPASSDVAVEITYVDSRREVLRRVRRLPPGVRTTVWVNRDDPEVLGSDAAVIVRAAEPVFVERAFRHESPGRTVPHDSVTRGTQVPAARWFFPDVDGRSSYVTTIPVLNPSTTDADISATAYLEHGEPVARSFAVGAGTRRELSLADLGVPAGTAVSVGIRSSVPIVAERVAARRSARTTSRRSSAGVTTAGTEWTFATTGLFWAGLPGQEGALVVTNVSGATARVEISSHESRPGYMGGSRSDAFVIEVGGNRVARVPILQEWDAWDRYIGADYVTVKSLNGAAIVVERTHMWTIDGVERAGATSIIGNVIK